MRVPSTRTIAAAAALATSVLGVAPASALNILLNPDASFSTQPNGAAALFAFQKAANYWNTVLTNNTTLVFNVSYRQLGANIIGSTGSNALDLSARSVYAGLGANAQSALDATAVANLHPLTAAGGIGYRKPGAVAGGLGADITNGSVYDNNDSYNNRIMAVNTSVAKVLNIGFSAADTYNGNAADANITFSSAFNFDFNPTDGLTSGSQDFISVATHEMGHALGFVSGADDYDYFGGKGPGAAVGNTINFDDYSNLTVLDLFRYSTNGPANSGVDPATGQRYLQLDPNRGAGFSVDGVNFFNPNGPGGFANFSTGAYNGDLNQASHWKDSTGYTDFNNCFVTNTQVGIMDPTSGACQPGRVTANDLAAFDAMGYNLNFDVTRNLGYSFTTAQIYNLPGLAGIFAASVPEPASWAQMILGFGVAGAALRGRRRTGVRFA